MDEDKFEFDPPKRLLSTIPEGLRVCQDAVLMDEDSNSVDTWSVYESRDNTSMSSAEIVCSNRIGSSSKATGWRTDSSSGKRSYSHFSSSGGRVISEGAEAFAMSMRDAVGKENAGKNQRASSSDAPHFKKPRKPSSSKNEATRGVTTSMDVMNVASNTVGPLPSSVYSLEPHGGTATGIGGGDTTRVMYNSNNALELPRAALLGQTMSPNPNQPATPGILTWHFRTSTSY